MQNLKRPIVRLLAVIFSVVLGSLFILGEPAFAQNDPMSCDNDDLTEHCFLTPGNEYILKANTGYKIKRMKPDTLDNDNCYGETIYATFNFPQIFNETYPIQDNWELHFNTPLSGDNDDNKLTFNSENNECRLEVSSDQTLELFSGFKSINDGEASANSGNGTGHFVIARDYYAVLKEEQEESFRDCKNNSTVHAGDLTDALNYLDKEKNICYQRLGTLTGITGKNFPALGGAVVAQIIIKPNSIRAPHWHLQFAEAGYCYEGIGQVGVIVPSNTIPKKDGSYYSEKIVEEIFLKENEVFLFPEGSQHYLRNIGTEDFKCALFFVEGTPLNGNQLLTITLQNIVGNTPVGVLDPVFVANDSGQINKISDSPAQTFSSENQRSEVIPVVEACSGDVPDINNPGCYPKSAQGQARIRFSPSLYSDMDP